MKMRLKSLLVAGVGLCLLATPAQAAEAFVSGGKLIVKSDVANGSNFTLTVVGPNGFYGQEHATKSVPAVSLNNGKGVFDGNYTWELTGSTGERMLNQKIDFFNGRELARPDVVNESFAESGTFTIVDGVPRMPRDEEEKGSEGGSK